MKNSYNGAPVRRGLVAEPAGGRTLMTRKKQTKQC